MHLICICHHLVYYGIISAINYRNYLQTPIILSLPIKKPFLVDHYTRTGPLLKFTKIFKITKCSLAAKMYSKELDCNCTDK